jgi:hypothetical protein
MGRSRSGVLDPVGTLTYASDDWALFWIDIGFLFRIFSIGVFWKRSGCSDVFTYIGWPARAAEV